MLVFVTAVKLIAETAVLALLGQWVLGLLAGAGRGRNGFYRILEIVGSPFVGLARVACGRFVEARWLPLVACLLLATAWLLATFLKIRICMAIGVALCR